MTANRIARMREAFTGLDIDTKATYRFTVTEGTPATVTRRSTMPGNTVHDLIRAQTRLAAEITQDGTGKIAVLLAHKADTRRKTCTYEKVTTREFIIVGQCQGTGYTLWDIAPAPTDPARRAAVLEELTVEAMDTFGSVDTEHGATAREALDRYLAGMRKQSGLDDYGLTADSQTECLRESKVDIVHGAAAASTGPVLIKAAILPAGPDAFQLAGGHDFDHLGYVRIHDGMQGAGVDFPEGTVQVLIEDHRNVTSTLDLAVACAILGAAGKVDRHALKRTVLLGELRFDGKINSVPGIIDAARAAHAAGYRAVMVPRAHLLDVRALGLGLDVIGVSTLGEAVDALNAESQTEGTNEPADLAWASPECPPIWSTSGRR
ncbi:magnesium chelatase domain-containing protein [Streptomyces sp. ME02-6987-2C]|uniref:magnesium chelatase domain-containing protein n=1 Tax=unclassified Streptomyces TaxID=2593676 RepID=UPI0029BD2DEC|nr:MULTISPECIES: magnesium chelatase domain-containing protein [unclassified Streptomyces]MDX3345916.1 magnesium chelatase domain-containing protein [Streptomyces sp. ME02-6979A]MDX3365110.1 magnesium chelatase domain-containing protein [Streptomyces sp. ME02-6987-2C]MDX3404834.1 magnesium chelatase domain-containing protein [Streptomyces sp. ME02-6977A]MDX3421682.1 magnesium chelatase domain-containing protein [Streptomyces sp. ME02-6985-2c]